MTANGSKSYLSYLNKLVDQCNNTYYYSNGKNPINSDYLALTEKIQIKIKVPKFKVHDRVRINKVTLKIELEKCLLSIRFEN